MNDAIFLPGTEGKRDLIEMILADFSELDPNYLVHLADHKRFAAIATPTIVKNAHFLLHWAVAHPYQDKLDSLKMTILISDRLKTVNAVMALFDFQMLPGAINRKNSWGETVLHIAVAAQNLSDSDTMVLLKSVLQVLNKSQRIHALNQSNNGNLSILDYTRMLNKPITTTYILSILSPKPAVDLPMAFFNNQKITSYFKKVGIDRLDFLNRLAINPFVSLCELYSAHIKTFPFQHFELRDTGKTHPLLRTDLKLSSFWKVTSNQDFGGYCFQSTQLFYTILQQLKFNVHRHLARVMNGMSANSKELLAIPPTHLILTVKLDDKVYYLDPGLANRAPRLPLLIDDQAAIVTQQFDQIQLTKITTDKEPVYIFSKKIDQKMSPVLQTNFIPVTDSDIQFAMVQLTHHPKEIPIRDCKLFVGLVTETGTKSLIFDTTLNQFTFHVEERGKFNKTVLPDAITAVTVLMREFNITHISAQDLLDYSKPEKPRKIQQAWEVDFPLDRKALASQMK